jgi:tRNA-binding protein
MKGLVSYIDFEKLDIRVGMILSAVPFDKAIKPAYQLSIDFGQGGIKKSSAQITQCYSPDQLVGKQIMAIVNFAPKQIANFMSECLVLGVVTESGVVLLQPDTPVTNGSNIA